MTEAKGYNGWTNYETWAVALWIGNEQGSYDYWEKEQAEECYEEAVDDDRDGGRENWTEAAANHLSELLKDHFEDEESCPLLKEASVYCDLLRAALAKVNWYEIANSYIEELDRDAIEQSVRG